MSLTLFRALRIRPFALLWGGQTVSRLGDGLFTVALSWWVLEQTGSAAAMGLVQIFRFLPDILFLLIGGVIADRLPRLRVMLASDLLRGLLLIFVAILSAGHILQLWQVYVASLLFGFVDSFFQPAYSAVIPDVVPVADLPSANALTSLSFQLSGILGTAAGGLIVAVGGSAAAFGLDGVSFFVAAICVLPILGRIAVPSHADSAAPNAVRELRDGLAAVWNIPWLRTTIPLAAFSNMFLNGALDVSMPFLIRDNLHADSAAFGFILALQSAGAIIGAIAMGSAGRLRHRGIAAYGLWITAAMLVAAIGLAQSVVFVATLVFFAGMTSAAGQLIWTPVLQELIPPNLLGRVSSVDQFGSTGLQPVGFGVAGWATGVLGAPLVFILGGLLSGGSFVLGLFSRSVRTLE